MLEQQRQSSVVVLVAIAVVSFIDTPTDRENPIDGNRKTSVGPSMWQARFAIGIKMSVDLL